MKFAKLGLVIKGPHKRPQVTAYTRVLDEFFRQIRWRYVSLCAQNGMVLETKRKLGTSFTHEETQKMKM